MTGKNPKREWRTIGVLVEMRATEDVTEKDLRWGVENILRETHPRWIRQWDRTKVGAFHVYSASKKRARMSQAFDAFTGRPLMLYPVRRPSRRFRPG